MSSPFPSLTVEVFNLHVAHPRLCASDWRSPLVFRLLGQKDYRDGEKLLSDQFASDIKGPQAGTILLKWEGLAEDFKLRVNTYQEPVLTEHAALAVACVLVRERAKQEITEVTRRGEKADYWLGDRELMIEVSGQTSGNLAALAQEKEAQLKANPHSKDGYVCVSDFSTSEAWLLFVRFGEVLRVS